MKKVNLSSQIYKMQLKQKSGTKLKLDQLTNAQSSSSQNICCPSCKYLFKVQQRSRTPKPYEKNLNININNNQVKTTQGYLNTNTNASPHKNSHSNTSRYQDIQRDQKKMYKNVQIQTQQYMMGVFKTSPKIQTIGKVYDRDLNKFNGRIDKIRRLQLEDSRKGIMTDRTPEHSPYFQDRLNHKMRSPFLTDRDKQTASAMAIGLELLTSRKRQMTSKSNQKISNIVQKQKSQRQKPQFPARSAYLNPKTVNQPPNPLKRMLGATSPTPIHLSPKAVSPNPTKPSRLSDLATLSQQNTLARQLLTKIQLSDQINQLIEYNINLSQQITIPSYCKMLLYDMKDRKQQNKLKQNEKFNAQTQKLGNSLISESKDVKMGNLKLEGNFNGSYMNGREKDEGVKRILNY